ncbi:hypothetical protein [Bathymodiolus heckerae thiotrophic gill symbiont]|uniref:hypothetical protein n=1 Tax=Bathymodiolus heckerae thiotrophic gill symbiont TaxID=1052212 RepID=UPI0010FD9BEC|nr:hypothetical protein [Bathymodiolus heckerae thiotrophic gill symbiont]
METLTIINYGLLLLTTTWTLFILFNVQANCKKNCNLDTIKKCVATYIFGLALILGLYFAHRWVLLG